MLEIAAGGEYEVVFMTNNTNEFRLVCRAAAAEEWPALLQPGCFA